MKHIFTILLIFFTAAALSAKDELLIEKPSYDAKGKTFHFELVNKSGQKILKYQYELKLKLDNLRIDDLFGEGRNMAEGARTKCDVDLSEHLSSKLLRKISIAPKIKADCSIRYLELADGTIRKQSGDLNVPRKKVLKSK